MKTPPPKPPSTPRTINAIVTDAAGKWVALTGYDREKKQFHLGRGGIGGLDEYDVKRYTDDVLASRELDPAGLTTLMLLRGILDHVLDRETFSACDLLLNPAKVEKRLAPMRDLRAVLEDEVATEYVDAFVEHLRKAAEHYGYKDAAAIEEVIAHRYHLALLRRDALRSAETLETHQFTQGDGDPNPPGLGTHVWEFWNMNSLLYALRAQSIPGVTVVLLRDPVQALQSYFVVAFRNGDNITILTDRDKGAHPLQNEMARRPDRDLERRAARHWFPYDLLDLQATEDQKRLYATARTGLVPINAKGVQLKSITELNASSFLWLVLLADLLRERFWERNEHVPQLSYTAEMVRNPEALVGSSGSLVVRGAYKPIDLPKVTSADITPEATAEQWEHDPTGHNRWLTERYAAAVPEEVLNPIGEEEATRAAKLLPEHVEEDEFIIRAPRDRSVRLHAVEPTTFGTPEQIQKDRVWIARYNQAKAVSAAAEREFEEKKADVIAWYAKAVRKNSEALLDAAARGTLVLPAARIRSGFNSTFDEKPMEAMAQASGKASDSFYSIFKGHSNAASGMYLGQLFLSDKNHGDVVLGAWRKQGSGCYDCFVKGVRASVFTVIVPTCPAALAVLAGVEVTDLPWALQRWFLDRPYTGNQILDRIDPEEWVIENPWRKLKLRVGIALSRRGLNERRARIGLPPKAWPESEAKEPR